MKIQPYIEKLEQSPEYTKFNTQYPDSFVVAGFFVLDFETNKNIHQIDFFIPSKKKVAAFSLDDNVTLKILDAMNEKVPEKMEPSTNIDLDTLKGILEDEMKNRSMSEEIKKMIAVVHTDDGKKIWNVNCILSGMEILKAHVEDESKTVLKIEKVSMLDIIKKIPKTQLQNMAPQGDAKEDINKLNKMESEIEKEKERLKAQLEKEKAEAKQE